MNEHAWKWAESLGHWALAWSLVVGVVGVWIKFGRPKRASLRYAGWLLATFAGMALMPVVFGLGPWVSWTEALALMGRTSRPAAEPVARFPSWFAGRPVVAGAPSVGEDLALAVSSSAVASPEIPRHPVVQVRGRRIQERWPELALGLWGAGVLVFAVRLGRDAFRVRALLAAATGDVPAELEGEAEAARLELGLRRRVRVLVHPELLSPMCVGLLRPMLLWPTGESCPMTLRQRRVSLLHELAHLKHGDDWIMLWAEIWRSLSWFYPPVHVLLGCLRREREYRCDDVASSRSEGPEGYARWLLDLAPLRVEPPALASSLLGGADLASRVRRLLNGESRLAARPLSRRQIAALGVLGVVLLGTSGAVRLVGFVTHANEAEPADAPLPETTGEALAAKIEAAWKSHETGLLKVEFDEEKAPDPFGESSEPIKKKENIKFQGRFQHASDGLRWRTEYDSILWNSRTQKPEPERWVTGFDGDRHYTWSLRENQVTIGESEIAALALKPRELFWRGSKRLIELLNDPSTRISQKSMDGTRCYLIEKTTNIDGNAWRTEYLIAPRRSYLAVAMSYFRNGQRYVSHRLLDLRQTERGHWIPGQIVSEGRTTSENGASRLRERRAMRLVQHEPGKAIAREDFALKIPINATVKDLTDGTAWTNDPWWPEVSKWLRERADWPPRDLSPLRLLQSHSDGKIEGRLAPPLEASHWINSEPIDWEQLRGKVVLIHFSPAATVLRESAAALRELGEVYHEAGLRVISVLNGKDEPEAARQYVKELRLTHPVAIDRPHAGERGATSQSFGMTYDSSVFLVDHLGKVRQVKEPGGLSALLGTLLRDAGAKEVVNPSPAPPQLVSDKSLTAIDRAFQDWLKQADQGGSLIGTIVDSEGMPIPGVEVRANAELRILMSIHGYHQSRERSSRVTLTGEAGEFRLQDLCKGNYNLRISAPGFATIERKALIEPTLGEVKFEAVMDQGDTISGRVLDDQGKPIANADVTISERRIDHKDGRQTNFGGFLEMKTTDAKGTFLFRKLPEGEYTLTWKSQGFSKNVRKNVPVGANNLDLTLDRVRP